MSKEVAIKVLADYIENAVESAKGGAVSISTRQINKWHMRRFLAGELARDVKFYINIILKALHRHGYLERVGKKFILHKSSQLWNIAVEHETVGFLKEFVQLLNSENEELDQPTRYPNYTGSV